MAKKPKGGRVTAPKESWPNMPAAAPTDPDEFWTWYRTPTPPGLRLMATTQAGAGSVPEEFLLRMTTEMKQALVEEARTHDRTIAQTIRRAIRLYLALPEEKRR